MRERAAGALGQNREVSSGRVWDGGEEDGRAGAGNDAERTHGIREDASRHSGKGDLNGASKAVDRGDGQHYRGTCAALLDGGGI
jgi:hypothetical protein